ncbi:MAG: 5-bromo-4-chloroindolyl phosphate hydrolysis family protein [Oscillospiraceae bacterium]|nr:5-bromo-4-chloroindolyl phosphate hydrolysis family protein [Oscillospiraceae bacterium]
MYNRRRRRRSGSIYSFIVTWLVLSMFFPMYELTSILTTLGLGLGVAFLFGRATGRQAAKEEQAKTQQTQSQASGRKTVDTTVRKVGEAQKAPKKSYGPEVDPIVEEGNKALSEMGRLYMSIKDPEVRVKINEIMRVTDKIVQDAIADPSDIPKIKKFMTYYLPTTIKLLNAYDRMDSQGIEGENIDKTMKNINEMLDAAIAAYKKQLDSLFANQALDIETDIAVMNAMLDREGLSDKKDFNIREEPEGTVATSSQTATR